MDILIIKYNLVSIAAIAECEKSQDYWGHLERESQVGGARGDPGELGLFLGDAGSLAGLVPVHRTCHTRVQPHGDQGHFYSGWEHHAEARQCDEREDDIKRLDSGPIAAVHSSLRPVLA